MRHRLALLLAASLLAAGCGDGASANGAGGADGAAARAAVAGFRCPADAGRDVAVPVEGRRPRVVTTVAPLTSIVSSVAGGAADVRGLVPEGQDSHTFEPTPSMARALDRADLVVLNGLQLEEPTAELARRRRGHGVLVPLGDLVLPRRAWLYDRSFPRAAGAPNPHLWTNPPMARCYAVVVGRVLAAADPDGADGYRRRATALADRIDALDDAMRIAAESVPPRHRALLTYHDAYAYTAAYYGWRVLGAIQPSSFDDPSPREVARLVEQVRETGVPAIFGSEVFPSPVLARIGEETGVRYVETLRDDDLPGEPGEPEHSYLELMRFNFVTIVRSLGGDASPLEALRLDGAGADRAVYPR